LTIHQGTNKRELLESVVPLISSIQKVNQVKMEQSGVCQVLANLLRVHLRISPSDAQTNGGTWNYQSNFVADSLIEAVAGENMAE
jgi:hypothetical protein